MNKRTSKLAQEFFGQFWAVKTLVTHCGFHGVVFEKLFSTGSGSAFNPRNPTHATHLNFRLTLMKGTRTLRSN